MKICVDAGHGGRDFGAVGYGLSEKDINLDISTRFEKLLKKKGYEVVMTRRKDITLSPKERVKKINGLECDLVISIHNNGSNNNKANGCEVIYPYKSLIGEKLSRDILFNISSLGFSARRVYYRLNNRGKDYYYIIREIETLSIIVECAFMTNYKDNMLLRQDFIRKRIAEAIAKAVIRYNNFFKTSFIL
ncbi:N-acetylmuramoyl-L-alanine amidase family protein [Caloranaerobacter ferrireducens]|uniref:N-acetylmuramoyl-L-alanine amidase family protein n=1 Tax=Caloranaerobacter ferrireducens TaxID=1323370 RepID=UPI00084D7BC7|nr:N-acetylmuramoyl-L-alanine amidase [Caloranaerobacter ferrireducens]